MSNEEGPSKADCYSEGERAMVLRYQQFKQSLLLPMLKLMTACRITPDTVTLFSLLLGFLFCPVYLAPLLYPELEWTLLAIAWVILVAHMLVDGIDGPLARFQNSAGQRGSFTDTMADQVALAAIIFTFVRAQIDGLPGLGVYAGGIFIFVYTVVVCFAMVRNAMGIPYRFLFRPRYWVWLLLFFEGLFIRTEWMAVTNEVVVWAFNIMLSINMLTGFLAIRRQL